MNIIKYQVVPEVELLDRLRQTRLKGFDGVVQIYKDATLRIVEQVNVNFLTPPQRYVLNSGIQAIHDLDDAFIQKGIDIFALRGALLFWLEGSDPDNDIPIPFLPPIVEDSIDKDGRLVKLVNDGMHRVYAARERNRCINIVHVTNVPKEYPYYSYPFMGGWTEVRRFDELPDEFQKKDYRYPENYKALFRQFNEIFPGVQAQRKQSNPSHIKE